MSDSRYYSFKKMAGFPVKYARESKTVMFLLCVAVGVILTFLLRDPEFAKTQDLVLFLLFLSIGLWITEAIRKDHIIARSN